MWSLQVNISACPADVTLTCGVCDTSFSLEQGSDLQIQARSLLDGHPCGPGEAPVTQPDLATAQIGEASLSERDAAAPLPS